MMEHTEEMIQGECLNGEFGERDINADRRLFSNIGIALTILAVVTFLAQYGLMVILSPWIDANYETYEKYQLLFSSIPMYFIGVPACILWFRRVKKAERIPKISWKPGKLLVTFIIAYSLLYSSNLFSVLLMFVVGLLRGKPVVNGLEAVIQTSDPWIMTLTVVVLAPIIEELLFRKILLDRIHIYGEKFCVLLSGLLFGLMHGNFYQLFYAFLLGVVFAYIYLKTGRIRYCIFFHMLINFMGSVVASWMLRSMMGSGMMENPMAVYENIMLVMLILGYACFLIAACIAGIILLICFRKQITFSGGRAEIPKGSRVKTVFLNPGMVLFFVVSVIQFVLSLG